MQMFQVSKKFPTEEKYGLTSQIQRRSRSVCSNIGEGYRKKKYPAHFTSKISDADMENNETQVGLDFAPACEYISRKNYDGLVIQNEEIGKLLSHIINFPEKYTNQKMKQ
jgi:four helix bundle protein